MNRKSFDLDLITMALYFVLVTLGWMTIYAVSSANGQDEVFTLSYIHGKQMLWIGISLVVGIGIIALDYRFLEAISYGAYLFSLILLIVVIFIGKEINGAKSWIVISGQPFQPSEFAKAATALALAKYLSRQNISMATGKHLATALLIILLPAVIIVLQNDTGSALVFGSFLIVLFRKGMTSLIPIGLIFCATIAILTLWAGQLWYVIGGIVGIMLISFFFFSTKRNWSKVLILHVAITAFFIILSISTDKIVKKLPEHQQSRIMVLFDPQQDPLGKGYNVIQSQIAISSGGLEGKGYLNGNYTKYRFVPKQETDFIFCTVGEEYGWLGSSFVILLFFFLIWRLKHLSENSKTSFSLYYGYAVLAIMFFHVVVNVGMTIGLVPVIGIPLPFFSYGGSSLLNFTILLSIMINFYSYRASVLGQKL
ncbi:MAG: rod shape-determining protein RodA [Bacteroidota bacterium]